MARELSAIVHVPPHGGGNKMQKTLINACGAVLITWAFVSPSQAQVDLKTPSTAPTLAVQVSNQSEPVLCAEKDNVALLFSNPKVQQFQIQAIHPSYINMIVVDRDAPDFTSCDMSQDPVFASDRPGQFTIYESSELWIKGFTFGSFWRPATVPVYIAPDQPGEPVRRFDGLHMLQLWVRHGERPEEVLVLYPPDGYWRARPLAYGQMRWTAYGSSFLVGPVEDLGRPVVALKSILFDPKRRTFELQFAKGGRGSLALGKLDRDHIVLDVTLDEVADNLPFAALRSMYVTRTNADVSEIAWTAPQASGWHESAVMTYPGGLATQLWAGRSTPSRHNLSAPDMIFGPFRENAK